MSDQNSSSSTADSLQVEAERLKRLELPTGVLGTAWDASDMSGNRVFAACVDGVYQVDARTGESERLYGHESYTASVACDPHRPVILSSGYDGQLIWYDLQRRSIFRRVQAHHFWSWQMAVSPDGKQMASVTGQYLAGGMRYEPAAESEPSVKVFDVRDGKLLHCFSHVPSVHCVAFSPCSQFVAAANLMGEIRIWDLQSGRQFASCTTDAFTSWGIIKSHCYIGGIHSLAFTSTGQHLIAVGMGPMRDPMAGNGRQLWQRFAWRDAGCPNVDQTREGESGEGLMETVACHPARPLFLMGGRLRGGDWNAAFFSQEDGHRLHHVNTGYRMTSASFHSTEQRLVLAGFDKQHPPKDGKFPPYGVLEVWRI